MIDNASKILLLEILRSLLLAFPTGRRLYSRTPQAVTVSRRTENNANVAYSAGLKFEHSI